MTSLRILLVEDDPNIRAVLAETLESLGHSVCGTAATEVEAVASAGRCMPDLMIVDIGLAVGSGVAAVARIVETGHVPHFFMSGVQPEYLTRGVPVLRKPVPCSRSRPVNRSRAEAVNAGAQRRRGTTGVGKLEIGAANVLQKSATWLEDEGKATAPPATLFTDHWILENLPMNTSLAGKVGLIHWW